MGADAGGAGFLGGKTLLIFDFDGTLADTNPLHARAFATVLEPLGVTLDYQAIAGMRTDDALEKLLADAGVVLSGEELVELCRAKQREVRMLIAEELAPLPGVHAFLTWAREHYRLALYSSGSRGTVGLALQKLGYSGWFDPLLCGDDVDCAKPDPEGYLKVLQKAGVAPHQALVFEDSDAGVRAAEGAQLAVVDVRPPFDFLLCTGSPDAS